MYINECKYSSQTSNHHKRYTRPHHGPPKTDNTYIHLYAAPANLDQMLFDRLLFALPRADSDNFLALNSSLALPYAWSHLHECYHSSLCAHVDTNNFN